MDDPVALSAYIDLALERVRLFTEHKRKMGYRSDVIIAMKRYVYNNHVLLLNDLPKEMRADSELWDNHTVTKDTVYWHTTGVKWYEAYPEVESVMGFLEEVHEEDYGFLRVGEDPGDIEELGTPCAFSVYANTTLDIPIEVWS